MSLQFPAFSLLTLHNITPDLQLCHKYPESFSKKMFYNKDDIRLHSAIISQIIISSSPQIRRNSRITLY